MSEDGPRPITPQEFDFLWEAAEAGEVPYPLVRKSHGKTMAERDELRKQTLAQLAQQGIVDQHGQVEPVLAGYFELLASAELSVDSAHLVDLESQAVLAVASARHGRGLLAVQDDRGLWLKEIPHDGLTSSIVALLPPAERGRLRSITLPVDALMAGAGADFMQRKDGDGVADADRKVLAQLHAEERVRGGQIGANALTELGGRSRSPVLSWFDTASGRYLTKTSTGADGREWITVAPADPATIRQRVTEMVASVQNSEEKV